MHHLEDKEDADVQHLGDIQAVPGASAQMWWRWETMGAAKPPQPARIPGTTHLSLSHMHRQSRPVQVTLEN